MSQHNLAFKATLDTTGLIANCDSAAEAIVGMSNASDSLDAIPAGVEEASESIRKFQEMMADKTISNDTAFAELSKGIESLQSVVPKTKEEFESLRDSYEDMLDALQNNGIDSGELYDKVFNGLKQVNKEMKEFVKNAKQNIDVDKKIEDIGKNSKTAKQEVSQLKRLLRDSIDGKYQNVTEAEMQKIAKAIANAESRADVADKKFKKLISDAKGFDFKGILNGIDTKMLGGMGSQMLASLATPTGAAVAGVALVGKTMVEAGKAAADFETHLDSLQALTGMTNEEMQVMSDKALTLGNEFGMTGSEVVDAMKLIGSQAPELLKNGDALEEVTANCATLAKASQIDLVEASSAVTTAMNQMGVSASETGKLINTLSAGAQQGSADVSYLKTVFEKAGTSAKQAGMDFTSLTAIIETVGPKFSSADEAGTALQSVLLNLSLSGKKEFMPSVVGMSKALENLAQAELSDAEMKQLVGKSGYKMLNAMIEGRGIFDGYNESLRDTNTAQEQYIINTDNMQSVVKKMKVSWQNFLVVLGQTGVMQEIAGNIQAVVKFLSDVIQKVGDVIKAFKSFNSAGKSINTFQLKLQLLKRQIENILTAVEIVVRLIAKAWNWCVEQFQKATEWAKEKWENLKSAMLKVEWIKAIYDAFKKAVEAIGKAIDWIADKWHEFLVWLGMETEKKKSDISESPAEIKIESDTDEADEGFDKIKNNITKLQEHVRKLNEELNGDISDERLKDIKAEKKIYEDQIKLLQKKRGLENSKSGKSDKNTGEVGSINYLQNKQQQLDKELNSKNISQARIDAIQKEKAKIQEEIDLLKLRNALSGATGNIKQMQDAYNSLGSVLENCELTEEEINKTIADRKAIQQRIQDEQIRRGLTEYQKGSLADQERELSAIENQLKNINLKEEERNRLLAERDKKKSDIENYKRENQLLDYQLNSLADLQAQLQKINQLRQNQYVSDAQAKEYELEANRLQKLINLENERLGLQQQVAIKAYTPETDAEKYRSNKEQSRQNYQQNFENFRNSVKSGDMGIEEFKQKMAEMKQEWESKFPGSKIPIKFDIEDGKIVSLAEKLDIAKQKMQELGSAVGSVGNMFSSLGNAIGGAGGAILNFVGQSLNSIGALIPQIQALTTAKQSEAVASGMAEASKAQPWFMIPIAIATVLGSILSSFNQMKGFASGGVVAMSSQKRSDQLIVRANPGEMILTNTQQARLFNLLDGKGSNGFGSNANITFEITGDKLMGVLNNYSKRKNRI